jgi:transcriptional regulator with XRE-family HTH domain
MPSQTYKFIEPVDLNIHPSGAPTMEPYVEPIHKQWSDEAYKDLDNPKESPQQALPLDDPKGKKKIYVLAKTPETKFGLILRSERMKKGLTHQEVSNRIGIPRRECGKIEQGTPVVPKIEKVLKFVDLYKLDRSYILQVIQEQKDESQKEKGAKMTGTKQTSIDLTDMGTPDSHAASIRTPDFRKAFSSVLENVSVEAIVRVAAAIGVPISKGMDNNFVTIDLHVHCPYCGAPSSSQNLKSIAADLTKEFHCTDCETDFPVDVQKYMEMLVRKEHKC